ncbi:MAG TPA: hypothetical protein VFF26_12160 [Gallionella sp.]|nr:hypothetical protein [Gallionella sp.]
MNIRNVIYMVATVSMFCTNVWAMEDAPAGVIEDAPARVIEDAPARVIEDVPAHAKQSRKSKSNTDAHSKRRGKTIDPHGRGLNQAQIDAMEAQRRAMWNATGGGMVYR